MINYEQTPSDFYDQQIESKNFLGAWFHKSRNMQTKALVDEFYAESKIIVDLGCGNSLWNESKSPAIGIDVNSDSLNYTMKSGRLNKIIVAPADKTSLPSDSADIVIITEVLEHLDNLSAQLNEIKRILKPGAKVICSVPYDTNFSFWRPLFAIQCFYKGSIQKQEYYKQRCGHINNFSPKSIQDLFISHGFKITKFINHYFFTIFIIASK
ncbi:class I SAM-dependent methyltransferase [Patescibacteria group bacterium]|nr:class I SAM-dependent methyltransferase [Candidatus Falkowbacteria bacterium]MBU3906174.1 class I SAM-dependent methyltransferase [Patescibacteria group bacterium]MCG2697496.1 class I SAM-dependent methyltransferase [Candidatus Parcubacteria bacterium]MBU4014994.1 class I SAM-dependent methyltransferase [Patescibacteria group bacterium]MBU4026667.1 class I SAM-dependent methyltransferase [Patescibacteria group bacterium]